MTPFCIAGCARSDGEYYARVVKLALDIANGMKYVASLRILHIDLKVTPAVISFIGKVTHRLLNFKPK